MRHTAEHNRGFQGGERDSRGRFTEEQHPGRQRSNYYNDNYDTDVKEQDEEGYDMWGQDENEEYSNDQYNPYSDEDEDRDGTQYPYERTGRGRGFGSVDRDEVRERGGRGERASFENPSSSSYGYQGDNEHNRYEGGRNGWNGSGRSSGHEYRSHYPGGRNGGWQGFASMDRDEVREAGRRGGRASFEGPSSSQGYRDYNEGRHESGRNGRDRSSGYEYGNGRNGGGPGFASMDRDEARRTASRGGRASNGGSSHNGRRSSAGRGRHGSSGHVSASSRSGKGRSHSSSHRRNNH